MPLVAALVVRYAGIPKVVRSILTGRSKSCDLYPALHRAIRGPQEVLPKNIYLLNNNLVVNIRDKNFAEVQFR